MELSSKKRLIFSFCSDNGNTSLILIFLILVNFSSYFRLNGGHVNSTAGICLFPFMAGYLACELGRAVPGSQEALNEGKILIVNMYSATIHSTHLY